MTQFDSARVSAFPFWSVKLPTDVHAWPDRRAQHETPLSTAEVAPEGLGVTSTVHVVPSQTSASVERVPDNALYEPTAVHAVLDVHDTDERELVLAPLGAEVGSIVHVAPFQTSAKVEAVPEDPV